LFKATNKNKYRENEARKNKKSEKEKNIEFDEDANAVDLQRSGIIYLICHRFVL